MLGLGLTIACQLAVMLINTPPARQFMTDVDRQTADRPDTYFDSASAYGSPLPDVYTSLTTRSYEYASHARPTVSHVDEA